MHSAVSVPEERAADFFTLLHVGHRTFPPPKGRKIQYGFNGSLLSDRLQNIAKHVTRWLNSEAPKPAIQRQPSQPPQSQPPPVGMSAASSGDF